RARVSWSDAAGNHEVTLTDLSLDQNDSRERTVTIELAKGAATGEFSVSHEVPGADRPSRKLTVTAPIQKPPAFGRAGRAAPTGS
ncbi:MAG TPA: hypothetical protein VG435_18815, partial [Acidimicrobiales bacterium]|nr:hypothetical protein [Acidimicrobiales bacterium]